MRAYYYGRKSEHTANDRWYPGQQLRDEPYSRCQHRTPVIFRNVNGGQNPERCCDKKGDTDHDVRTLTRVAQPPSFLPGVRRGPANPPPPTPTHPLVSPHPHHRQPTDP